jgi:hypothetical protein
LTGKPCKQRRSVSTESPDRHSVFLAASQATYGMLPFAPHKDTA